MKTTSAAQPDKPEPCAPPHPVEMAVGPLGADMSLGLGMFSYKRGQHLLSKAVESMDTSSHHRAGTQSPDARGHENVLF